MSDTVTEADKIEQLTRENQSLERRLNDKLTLRDHFAMAALNGLLSEQSQYLECKSIAAENAVTREYVLAHFAYKLADAMLEARKAKP